MPRGKFTSHKGRNRRFTNPEELEEERRKEQEKSKWRAQRDISSSDEEEEATGDKKNSEDSDSEESSDDDQKAKGVHNLIEIENPNRVQKKSKKLTTLNTDLENSAPQLSRREREEIERQKAKAQYQKLHAEGKTDQAKADLARLAIIKQQREEARLRRENEQKEKDEAARQKTAQTQKALGKK
ncbi:hypothetical protein WA026_001988 [Henosepilachna vigintioctopunctata]|uniref:Casein kinase substrate phosphoprotein PP28 domain-containing protein n=1 Tax=Henosepilachna vigintioctopunctata TaxID=420089 RepID=A0AAW1ULX6_9CUCU